MKVLVVPTIRETHIFEFLQAWRNAGFDEIIVVEDNPSATMDITDPRLGYGSVRHYAWDDIESDLGTENWIISRRDSAIRSYGFLKAWELGAKTIFTLDDDCFPIGDGKEFVAEHLKNLYETPAWTSSIGVRTRGLPYLNLGKLWNVNLSVGLWTGIPDFDSIQTLSGADPDLVLPETRIMPSGQYFPICGMNMAFDREFAPLAYFPLMGEGQPYRRFDDIWFGVIAKKISDHLHWHIACGKPYIEHRRASDPMTNLIKEAPGIKRNESFWEAIDDVCLTEGTTIECLQEMAYDLENKREDEYLYKLGKALRIWSELFESKLG